MSKSVCIIRSNPVRPDSRVEKEAYTLKKNGYAVHILAWDRDDNYKVKNDYIEVLDERIPITRLGYKASFGEGMKNIIPYLKFQFGIMRYLMKNKFNVVHACDFDTAFFSLPIVKIKKEKFIFDIFDFLASDPVNLLQKIIRYCQIMIINNSDGTIICTEQRKSQISGSYPKRLAVIHNTPMSEMVFENKKERISDAIKVVYVGILQDYRLLKEISNFFIKNPEIEWHVAGFGKYEKYFKEISALHKNIVFYGKISYSETLELEKSCDIMLAIYDPMIDNHKYAAPNKFYESLMLGKPVIMVEGTGMSESVRDNEIGVLINYSEEGFATGLLKLIEMKEEWNKMSSKMKKLYETHYNWKVMQARLIELYKSI